MTNIDKKKPVLLTEEGVGKDFILAKCCKPIPGDDVLGYLNENNRIIIHKRQCPIAAKLKSSQGNRILAAEWHTNRTMWFSATIQIKGIDDLGLLNEITQIISRQLNVNIHKLCVESNEGIFEGQIELNVHDVEDVKTLCTSLRQLKNVQSVIRV